jgi:hypothetical protein
MVTTHSLLESYEIHLKRCYTAISLDTPIKDLLLLVTDENYFIWDLVAENPNCPHYIKRYIVIKKYLMRL